MEEFKVLITTSGIGSRLGELTNYTNKSLIRIGKKPAISYIIENYPPETNFVITLGYYGNQVKDFLELAYPEKKFEFVLVENFSGNGSSLGWSMLCAKNNLQCPFIYHASDTLVFEEIPVPEKNWIIGCKKENTSNYRTIKKGNKFKIYDKGQLENDNLCYIGVCGIKDYNLFWNSLDLAHEENKLNNQLCDCDGINKMNLDFDIVEFNSWLDIGSSSELKEARHKIYDKFEILDKVDESIFLFNDFVIKFFFDKKLCKNRVKRCDLLDGLTPKIIDFKDNFYKYEHAKGDLLSDIVNDEIFESFLFWSKENLWKKNGEKNLNFKKSCEDFYFNKTKSRVENYLKINNLKDEESIINKTEVPSVFELLNLISKDWICDAEPYQFHGDYILDNVLYQGKSKFVLLDWRQDFSNSLIHGDIYYDLAKMNHNLIINHKIVHKKLYNINYENNEIFCDILCSKRLIDCQKILHNFILKNGMDLKKVEILTSIIWLNMSPLHEYPLNDFLFNFGKINLYKQLKKYES